MEQGQSGCTAGGAWLPWAARPRGRRWKPLGSALPSRLGSRREGEGGGKVPTP